MLQISWVKIEKGAGKVCFMDDLLSHKNFGPNVDVNCGIIDTPGVEVGVPAPNVDPPVGGPGKGGVFPGRNLTLYAMLARSSGRIFSRKIESVLLIER